MLGLVYLNAGLRVSDDVWGWGSHKALATILSNPHFRDEIGSPVVPKQLSFMQVFSACSKERLPRDILLYIESLLTKYQRERFVRIRYRAISQSDPENLIMKLIRSFGAEKIERLLGTLAPKLGFEKPMRWTWSRYFESWSVGVRDKAMLDLLTGRFGGRDTYRKYPEDWLLFLAAIECTGGIALQYASNSYKNDPVFLLAALKRTGNTLRFLSDAHKNDRTLVLAAVRKNGWALQYASRRLKNDRAIVLAAIQQNGSALKYAGAALKDDRVIVLAAVQQDGCALYYASAAWKNDPAIVFEAVKQVGGIGLSSASNALKNNRAFVLAAVKQWSELRPNTGGTGRKKSARVREAVQNCVLRYAGAALQRDPAFVRAAVEAVVPGAIMPRFDPPISRNGPRRDPILSSAIR